MNKKINIVVAGDSSFSWYLVNELKDEVTGRLYFVLEDKEQAIEASLLENVIAITGDITDTKVLDQLGPGRVPHRRHGLQGRAHQHHGRPIRQKRRRPQRVCARL